MPATPSLRERIVAQLNDEELRLFCADHFTDIGREFTAGMTLSERAQLLIERCARTGRAEALLTALVNVRPSILGDDRTALLADLAAQAVLADLLDQPPQKIVNARVEQHINTATGSKFVGVEVNVNLPPPLPPPSARHQLRAPVADFVGRSGEIAAIVETVQPAATGTAMAISGLRGLGGIGKTELAYAAAQHLAPLFPDAQIVLALRGASDTPLSSSEALKQVLRVFQPTAQLPDIVDELERLYRSELYGQKVLILADDAKDAAQVRPLLPPPGSALLVTSRQRFTLPGIRARNLDTLPLQDAAALLLAIHPPIGDHAAQLAQLCGHLPLALRVSASLLATSSKTVARYLEQLRASRLEHLRDPDDPQASVAASLQLSYDALDPMVQTALTQLAVFPASFDRAAALAVLDTGDEGEGLLDRLVRRSLLEWDAASERFDLHDLVRVFAAERLVDVEAVRLRHARHYANLALSLQEAYRHGGMQLMAGLALFDRERVQIDTGWQWVRDQAGTEDVDRVLQSFSNLTGDIGPLRYDTRRERIPQLEAALAAARRRGDRGAEGAWLGNLGNAHADLGDARRAIDYHEQDLAIARELGDRLGEGAALGNLGSAHADLGDARRAIEFYEQHLTIAREIGDRRGEGAELGNLGSAHSSLGNARRAIELYEQHLTIAREIGDRVGEAFASWNLGLRYEAQGDLARAVELMQVCVDFEREIGHPDAEPDAERVEALHQRLAAGEGEAHPDGSAT